MLGPEANHFVLVSHADHFRWRDGAFGDLIPLLGDGMLTIDGDFHRRSRRIMLPAFHRERIAAAHGAIAAEVDRAVGRWQEGARLDLYRWSRELALRVALRALFGFDPDKRPPGLDPTAEFERALSFYGREYVLQILRGPRTPFAEMMAARRRLDELLYGEIARRRRSGERGEDLLSLLLDARDEDGTALSERHVRDHLMTMLFAGHDTTTATVSFLFYELARAPEHAARLAAERAALVREPTAADLVAGTEGPLPQLEQAIEETLRLYPPAWIGPRRAARAFEFGGHSIPRGALVNYSSWASHRLPDVWEDPHAFRPRALRARGAQADPARRLRAVRRRLAHLPGHALRSARDPHDRRARAARLPARARARLPAGDPPDADLGATRRVADGRNATGVVSVRGNREMTPLIVALILTGAGLLVAEAHVASYGALGAAGVLALVLAAVLAVGAAGGGAVAALAVGDPGRRRDGGLVVGGHAQGARGPHAQGPRRSRGPDRPRGRGAPRVRARGRGLRLRRALARPALGAARRRRGARAARGRARRRGAGARA